MKKTNQFFCFAASLRVRYALIFCLNCFVFTITIGQVIDSTKIAHNTDGKVNATSRPLPKSCNDIFAGFSSIFEDSKPDRFNTYGGNLAFMHPVSPSLGLTGDAGVYFGSNNGIGYTKGQVLVGASLLPVQYNRNELSFSPHVLAGVSNVTSKISTFSNSSTSFSADAGVDVRIPISKKAGITARIDYNPTFPTGGIKNNFRVGVGLDLKLGCGNAEVIDNKQNGYTTREKPECKASKDIKELKISLSVIEMAADFLGEFLNKIPRVEAKISVKPQITVKQGEECCSKDLPPASYTELKGGVEGSAEINLNLWGIPDINYSLKLWPVLIIAEFKCKLFAGPTGKINLDGVGKFYGELGKNPRPDCKACFYFNVKLESFLRIGIKAGGGISIYHWSILSKGKAGFDVNGKPDEKVEVSAEASVSVGCTANGTYAVNDDCKKPPPGLHAVVVLGKAKANLKFNVKLGPLSFDPNFEFNLFDGWEVTF